MVCHTEAMCKVSSKSEKVDSDFVTFSSTHSWNCSKHNYNLRFKQSAPIYAVGQQVYRRSFTQSSAGEQFYAKLGPAYIPCRIISKRGKNSYELEDESGKNLGISSASDLKPVVPDRGKHE